MKKFFAALLMLGAFNSYAGIQVDATRVIYKGDDKSASLPIHNDASGSLYGADLAGHR